MGKSFSARMKYSFPLQFAAAAAIDRWVYIFY